MTGETGKENRIMTRTQKVKETKTEQPQSEAIPEPQPRLIERLTAVYSTEHLPDTHSMELQGGK